MLSGTLKEIQKAIAALSPEERAELRRWFEAFDAEQWDAQFEADVRQGKLHKIAEEALRAYRAGDVKEL